MSAITLGAPLAGWLAPLSEVPDPVFAEGMMGEGFAIDPVDGLVRAPCAATVEAVAPTGHSVTLRLDGGAMLLIHVGVETVALRGEGFETRTAPGMRVAAGDVLIAFDLDRVARGARSLMTPVVLVEGGSIELGATGRTVGFGDPVAAVRGVAASAERAGEEGSASRSIVLPLANGIHARPAARIVAALKPFAAEVTIAARGRTANARSVVSLLSLGAVHGEAIEISAAGGDAAAAVDAVVTVIEGIEEAPHAAPAAAEAPVAAPRSGTSLPGVQAAPGLAIGPAWWLVSEEFDPPEAGRGIGAERAAFGQALAATAEALGREAGDIAAAHRALLDDPELLAATERGLADGRSAGWAWRDSTRAAAAAIGATGDPLLAERVADLRDLERQLLARLAGVERRPPDPPAGAILLAEELLPSDFMALPAGRIAGVATARGGPTSHVAILAASAGVPMLVALGPQLGDVADGDSLVLDAGIGRLETAPDPAMLDAAERRLAAERQRRAEAAAAAHAEARLSDGTRIEVFANLGSVDDAAAAVAAGAEGCGLLRTEFLFLDRETAPNEDEQAAAYRAIAAALGDHPLIVRTLDIGGDKPVPYLPLPAEENPALGLRGVRLSLARPDLLRVQLRAILRGVPPAQLRIMVPMVADRADLAPVRAALVEAAAALGLPVPPLGVMIETPAAAILADTIAAEADFLSVGTNDLTQYALACDRGNRAVAARIDALHPAVLRLIAAAAEGAAAHGRWIGVCGGLASDPAAAAVLVGLGVTELSATPAAVPAVKAALRGLTLDACRQLASRALACAGPDEVRALLAQNARHAPAMEGAA